MSDGIGIFEHADHIEPRREHGYCTDDVARLLIAIVREPSDSQALRDLGRTALRFLALSQSTTGRTRNRRDAQTGAGTADTASRIVGVGVLGLRQRRTPCAGGMDALERVVALRPRSRPAVTASPQHGVRSARRRRDARRPSAPSPCPRSARRCDRHHRAPSTDEPGRGPSHDWPTRMPHCPKRSSLPGLTSIVPGWSTTDSVCCAGCSTAKRSTVTCRRPPSAEPAPMSVRRCSISSRSRSPPWQTPAPGRWPSPATTNGSAASTWRSVGTSARTISVHGCGTTRPRGGYDGLTSLGPNLNEGAESTLALITTMQYAASRSATRTPAPALFNASAG